jgi:cell division transport system permease protein
MKDFFKKAMQFRIAGSYMTSTISTSLLLLMIGFLSLIILNTNRLLEYAQESITVSVILKETALENEITQFQKSLDKEEYILETEFVSKEDALKEVIANFDENPMEILDYNPLPATIKIKVRAAYANIDSLSSLEERIKQQSCVKGIIYPRATVDQVNTRVNIINIVIGFFAFLMFIISIVLINNTIRLLIYSKRFLIKTMQLIGATNFFIAKPFVIKSALHGAICGMISILMILISIIIIQSFTKGLVKISDIGNVFLIIFVAGVIITSFSTFLSIKRYLNTDINNLYY